METRSAKAKNGARPPSENREKDCASSQNYIAVLVILNTIVERVSSSLPHIRQAARMLPDDIFDTGGKLGRCLTSR